MILSKVEKITYDLALPIVDAEGYEIYDVEYVKEGPHWFLRLFISRDEGVNVDDCETISRALSNVLDEKDCVQTNYFLEVSSPGIERNLRQEEHFEAAIGEGVKIKLYKDIDGVKEIEGELVSADHNIIAVNTTTGQIEIDKKNIAKANIKFEF
ncbi:MAG: ribosome maturation factor RimP [Clostridia bacterium]|nr:ribosome maturation factor RimP [Clostridia bacterium]